MCARRAKGHSLAVGWMVAACATLALGCGKIGYDADGVDGSTAPDADWRPPGDASSDRSSMRDGVGSDDADISDRGITDFDVSSDTAIERVDSGDSGRGDANAMCPSGITTSATILTPRFGGSTGPSFLDACPSSQAVVGFSGKIDLQPTTTITTLRVLCGQLSIDPATCDVHVLAGASLPVRGVRGTVPYSMTCPSDTVVVGLDGQSGMRVHRLSLVCAPLSLSLSTVPYQVIVGPSTSVPPGGGDAGQPFMVRCGGGHIAGGAVVGLDAMSNGLENIGLMCGTPTVQ